MLDFDAGNTTRFMETTFALVYGRDSGNSEILSHATPLAHASYVVGLYRVPSFGILGIFDGVSSVDLAYWTVG